MLEVINEFTKNPVTQASSMKRYGNLVDCATRSAACVFNQYEEETILPRGMVDFRVVVIVMV